MRIATISTMLALAFVIATGAAVSAGDFGSVDAFADSGEAYLSQAKDGLVIQVNGDEAIITNVGGDKRDVGGLRITAGGVGMADLVGITPYTCILYSGQSCTVKLDKPVATGESVKLTNGMGIYTQGTAR